MKENKRRWWWCLIFTSCTCSDLVHVSYVSPSLNVWSRTWGDGCTANQRFPHGRCQLGREGLGCAPRRCPLRASSAAGHRKFLPRLPSTLSLTWKILEAWLVEVSVETASTASTNNFKKKWSSLMFSVLEFGSTIVMQLPSDLPRDQGICPVRNQCIFKATYGHMATTPPTEFSETL